MTIDEKVDFLSARIWSAHTWLEDHGRHSKKPRPDFEIEQKERSLRAFEAILGDYQAAKSRRAG